MKQAIVIGAGILGTMHAYYLRASGFAVTHLDADCEPSGASVRNFGLIWVSGRRIGAELDAATRARELWEQVGRDVAGTGFRAEGSLTVALHADEWKVMEEYAATPEAAAHGTVAVDAGEIRRRNPAVRGEVLGGLWCGRDAVVEPRAVLGALRAHLATGDGYRFVPGCRVTAIGDRGVSDDAGRRWDGDLVVVATGAAHDGLLADHLAQAPVRRVHLQMLQTAPLTERLTTSIADADSLRYYPAYEGTSLGLLPPQTETAQRHHLQLLLVQRRDGGLTVGDTHRFVEPFPFDLDEGPMLELLDRAGRILGRPLPPAARRWSGVYSQSTDPDRLWYREEVRPGVWVVTGPGGRGMTCAPAIAVETLTLAGFR